MSVVSYLMLKQVLGILSINELHEQQTNKNTNSDELACCLNQFIE